MEERQAGTGRRFAGFAVDAAVALALFLLLTLALGRHVDTTNAGVRIGALDSVIAVQLGGGAYLLDGAEPAAALGLPVLWLLLQLLLEAVGPGSVGQLVARTRRAARPTSTAPGPATGSGALPGSGTPAGYGGVGGYGSYGGYGGAPAGPYGRTPVTMPVAPPLDDRARSHPPLPDARWDDGRATWIRWDGAGWTAFDPGTGSWRPL